MKMRADDRQHLPITGKLKFNLRVKGDRILSQIDPLSIKDIKDFLDHRQQASRFIGVASALLADDTDIQRDNNFDKCQLNCEGLRPLQPITILGDARVKTPFFNPCRHIPCGMCFYHDYPDTDE